MPVKHIQKQALIHNIPPFPKSMVLSLSVSRQAMTIIAKIKEKLNRSPHRDVYVNTYVANMVVCQVLSTLTVIFIYCFTYIWLNEKKAGD